MGEKEENVVILPIHRQMMPASLLENIVLNSRRVRLVSDDEHEEEHCLCCYRSMAVA